MNEISEKCWKTIGVFGNGTCVKLYSYGHCRHCPEYSKAGRKLLDREIPSGSIDEWTDIISKSKETEIPGSISVVVFRLKSEWLALASDCFQEAVDLRPIHYIPFRTNNVFKGLVNVNGELLICISTSDLLGVNVEQEENEQKKMTYKRMIVVARDGERYVFTVDEMLGVLRISHDDLQKTPVTLTKSPTAFSSFVFDINREKVGLIDEDKFFRALKRSFVW